MPVTSDYVDLDRYPIHQGGPLRDAVIATTREAIDSVGCAVLKGSCAQSTCRTSSPSAIAPPSTAIVSSTEPSTVRRGRGLSVS